MADNKELQEAKKLLQEINTLRGRLNQTPLKMTDSDAVQNIQSLRNELKGVQKSFEDVDTSATSLYDQVRAISSEFKNQPGALQKIRGSMKKITSIAEDLKLQEQGIKDLSTKQLDDLSQRLKENKKLLDDETQRLLNGEGLSDLAQREIKDLQQYLKDQGGINNLTKQQVDEALQMVGVLNDLTDEQKAALANYVDQGNAIGDIEGKLEEVKEQQKEVNKLMGVGGAVIDGLDGLMGKLGMSSSRFKDAVSEAKDKMKAAAEEIQSGARSGGKLSVLMAGLGPLAKGFGAALLDPLSLILKIVDAFFKVDKASTEVQRLTGQNSDAIAGANFRYATSVDYLQTIAELTKQTGMSAQNIFSPKVIAGAAELKNTMGLAADEAGGLAIMAQTTSGDIDKTVDSIVDQTSAFNKANRSAVNQNQVLKDVAKTSDGIKASLGGNPAAIAKAASAARRLGMELGQLDKIAGSLLDFEDSISKEMEGIANR
jgi:methyl-accepting chemotaxis protein